MERLALGDGRLRYRQAGSNRALDLRARRLDAAELLSWEPDSPARASLAGELNGSAVDWTADLWLFRRKIGGGEISD